jgi:predicted Zn-dependent peptidase
MVFETDSITSIGHQLGYYETVASAELVAALPSRIAAVTIDEVATAASAVLVESNRTIGTFVPQVSGLSP